MCFFVVTREQLDFIFPCFQVITLSGSLEIDGQGSHWMGCVTERERYHYDLTVCEAARFSF